MFHFNSILYIICDRKSASCTHVSAVLHALAALTTKSFSLQPNIPVDDITDDVPCTSLPCTWKAPKKRKESVLEISKTTFEKHEYAKPNKRKIQTIEDFDPRPAEYKGSAIQRLPELLQKIKGDDLCLSLLLGNSYQPDDDQPLQPSSYNLPGIDMLKQTMQAFKDSMQITAEKAREIERNTRDQRSSSLWYYVRRYRLTASIFGQVLSRKSTTAPDSLVLQIIQQKRFSTAAVQHGIDNEQSAVNAYLTKQQGNGHLGVVYAPSGFVINPKWPFLGASPDGVVYDPTDQTQPYGFLEIKCPYTYRNITPIEACSSSSFYCYLDPNTRMPKLKETHHYYAQIQGQMAIGERPWCDFVIHTFKDTTIQRVSFDLQYWLEKLLPKLQSFYDNCLLPEIVSPVHSIGLPVRDLSKV